MTERQKTFGDTVGMDSSVPTAVHRDDWIKCSDGTLRHEEDVFRDCRDVPHGSKDDRHEADVTIVEELLDGVDVWVTEYCTENSDYADGYSYVVNELRNDWHDKVEDWIGYDNPDLTTKIADKVCEDIDGEFDCEQEYSHNEYSCYDGDGCCLFSDAIGEYENQLELSAYDELQELHDDDRLDDVLDDVNCDVTVSRSKNRVKNEKTGYYEGVGRETYKDNSDHPCLMTYHMPGGQWHFVVPAGRMEELITEAILELARRLK